MLDTLFSGLYAASSTLTMTTFSVSIAAALLLGAVLAVVSARQAACSQSFAVTLAMLPAVVSIVIMMVSGSLGAGVAVAGTFSLVRFRSAPGTAQEIGSLFLAMAVGLACGMGYVGFAALFTIVMCAVSLLYQKINFGGKPAQELCKILRITMPEDLDYSGVFDDLFAEHTAAAKLLAVKTSNLGSLNKLTYAITLKEADGEKRLIDALRCRNGNLEISSSIQATDGRDL